jgi:hypothetical protein
VGILPVNQTTGDPGDRYEALPRKATFPEEEPVHDNAVEWRVSLVPIPNSCRAANRATAKSITQK